MAKKNKNKLSGFMNNIMLFIITFISSIILLFVVYKASIVDYCICNQNYCNGGSTTMKFNYTPGTLHTILITIFMLIFVATIICSIYFIIKKKENRKKYEIILNIIFAIINVLYIWFIPYNTFKSDKQYGNEMQINQDIPNGYIKENCNGGN